MVASKKLDAKAKGITVLKAKKGEDVAVSNNGKRSDELLYFHGYSLLLDWDQLFQFDLRALLK